VLTDVSFISALTTRRILFTIDSQDCTRLTSVPEEYGHSSLKYRAPLHMFVNTNTWFPGKRLLRIKLNANSSWGHQPKQKYISDVFIKKVRALRDLNAKCRYALLARLISLLLSIYQPTMVYRATIDFFQGNVKKINLIWESTVKCLWKSTHLNDHICETRITI
jgi:hypothetical protein